MNVIDPVLSCALAVQSRPGAHAVLLGSGVSASAGVPTGWGVMLDLIRRVAAARGDDAGEDPAGWYRRETGRTPDYSELVEQLAATPEERLLLLSGYFEASDIDREEGRRVPTPAHHAIARLVAGGYVRVVVTTNFDRLLEQALQAEGVAPIVVYTADQVEGMLPLQHATADGGVLVVKPHGDYRDTRLRNTTGELNQYEPPMRDLLDRLFAEYGLIVCGWSGDWDPALRDCVERATRHRFSTFWMSRGSPSDAARQIVAHRQATLLPIESADAAWSDLERRVVAVSEMRETSPLDARVAVSLVKRYLPDERDAIRLDDVVMDEVRAVVRTIVAMPTGVADETPETYRAEIARVEMISSRIAPMAFVGGFFGSPRTDVLFGRCVRALSIPALDARSGLSTRLGLRRYPALLTLYAFGVGLTAANRFDALRPVLVDMQLSDEGTQMAAAIALVPHKTLRHPEWLFPEAERAYSPEGKRITQALRGLIADVLPPELTASDDINDRRWGGFEERSPSTSSYNAVWRRGSATTRSSATSHGGGLTVTDSTATTDSAA